MKRVAELPEKCSGSLLSFDRASILQSESMNLLIVKGASNEKGKIEYPSDSMYPLPSIEKREMLSPILSVLNEKVNLSTGRV